MFNIEIAFVEKYYTWDHTLDPEKKTLLKKSWEEDKGVKIWAQITSMLYDLTSTSCLVTG